MTGYIATIIVLAIACLALISHLAYRKLREFAEYESDEHEGGV